MIPWPSSLLSQQHQQSHFYFSVSLDFFILFSFCFLLPLFLIALLLLLLLLLVVVVVVVVVVVFVAACAPSHAKAYAHTLTCMHWQTLGWSVLEMTFRFCFTLARLLPFGFLLLHLLLHLLHLERLPWFLLFCVPPPFPLVVSCIVCPFC